MEEGAWCLSHAGAACLLPGHWLQAQPLSHLGIQGCSAESRCLFFLRIHTRALSPPQPQSHKGWLRHLFGAPDSPSPGAADPGDFLHSVALPCLSSPGCFYPRGLKSVLRSVLNKVMGIVTILFIAFFSSPAASKKATLQGLGSR